MINARQNALEYAVKVCGASTGEHVLGVARQFDAFLSGNEQAATNRGEARNAEDLFFLRPSGVPQSYLVAPIVAGIHQEPLDRLFRFITDLSRKGHTNTLDWSRLVRAEGPGTRGNVDGWAIYKLAPVGGFGLIGTSETPSFEDDNIDPDITSKPVLLPRAVTGE